MVNKNTIDLTAKKSGIWKFLMSAKSSSTNALSLTLRDLSNVSLAQLNDYLRKKGVDKR